MRNGVGIGSLGVGAGQGMNGIVVSGGVAGCKNVTGLGIAGGYMRIEEGSLRGISVSGFNDIRGTQRGLTIGLINYARTLHGIQLGLVNIARNSLPAATILDSISTSEHALDRRSCGCSVDSSLLAGNYLHALLMAGILTNGSVGGAKRRLKVSRTTG